MGKDQRSRLGMGKNLESHQKECHSNGWFIDKMQGEQQNGGKNVKEGLCRALRLLEYLLIE